MELDRCSSSWAYLIKPHDLPLPYLLSGTDGSLRTQPRLQISLTHEHADAVLGLDDICAVQPFSRTNEINSTPVLPSTRYDEETGSRNVYFRLPTVKRICPKQAMLIERGHGFDHHMDNDFLNECVKGKEGRNSRSACS